MSSGYLSEEELLSYAFTGLGKPAAEVIKEGAIKVPDPNEGFIAYHKDGVVYEYLPQDESKPVAVSVYKSIDEGIRGIKVGDTFESVIEKFPQDSDWQTSEYGVIYDAEDEGWAIAGEDEFGKYVTAVVADEKYFVDFIFNKETEVLEECYVSVGETGL